ncbi:hypothetical protein L7F22_011436 [Adiantum nelumboides]|nr:hypothetical protein [Adiantum nelumboides]
MYMIFVKDSLSDVNKTQVNESGSKEDLELSKFLNQFQDVFIDDIPGELPPKRGDDDHAIELIPGSSPPNKPPYRVSQAQQEEIMRQVNELVEKRMVRPSSSPFCSPVLLVHKKDGTYRMCVDYRALNKITIKNRFLVPHIEDLFDKLQGSTYFSRIDLKSGYHQIRIVNEDILKTAFRTTFGLYEYLVMPFGLTNAPATFNRMMERIFRPHRNFTGVFFDDVIIYSKSMEEHKKHLQCMMDVLVNKGLAAPLKDHKEGVYIDDQWEELDARARATIWLHLGKSIFFTIMDKTSAFELWYSLCSTWDGKSASNKVFLTKKLMRLSIREGSSIRSHLNEFNALYLQLTSKGLNFNDEMKDIFLICSLTASWDTFNTSISNSIHGGKLTFGDVTSALCIEEI